MGIKWIFGLMLFILLGCTPLKADEVTPKEWVLTQLEKDKRLTLEQKAYVAATVEHETAYTFKPLREYGLGKGHPYGKVDDVTGHRYYGRGYVQLTWKHNYKVLGSKLGIDLVNYPEKALQRDTAYDILIIGMAEGLFNSSGKGLDYYINDQRIDYYNARRTVNLLDDASKIADRARHYENTLEDEWNQ